MLSTFICSQTTKGGVILPETGLGKVLKGTVISAGPGGRDNVSLLHQLLMMFDFHSD